MRIANDYEWANKLYEHGIKILAEELWNFVYDKTYSPLDGRITDFVISLKCQLMKEMKNDTNR